MDEHEQTDTLFDFQWPNNLDVCVFYSKSTVPITSAAELHRRL